MLSIMCAQLISITQIEPCVYDSLLWMTVTVYVDDKYYVCVVYCIQSKPADDYEKMPSDKMSQQNSPARAVNGYDAQQVIREGDVYPIDDKTRRHLGIVSVGNMLTFKTHKQSNLSIEKSKVYYLE